MNVKNRIPRWAYGVYAVLWVLLLASFADYYVRYQRINPLGVLLLVIIVVGSIIGPRWLKQPFFSREGMQDRLILVAFLLGMVIGFAAAFMVVIRTCL
jgi:hypothetical protein